jgi:hypothetical protein
LSDLIDAIGRLSTNRWHCLDSTWLIVHVGDAITIENALKPYLPRTDDHLLVAIMGKDDAAWTGFDQKCSDWLMQNLL